MSAPQEGEENHGAGTPQDRAAEHRSNNLADVPLEAVQAERDRDQLGWYEAPDRRPPRWRGCSA